MSVTAVEASIVASRRMGGTLAGAVVGALLALAANSARADMDVAGTLIEFNDNGAWSWFEDERAIVDVAAGKILVSSVANAAGTGGVARNGDVEVASYDIATGQVSAPFTLHNNLEADDHDSAALWQRPDGKYLAMYSGHHQDQLTRYRISTAAGDPTQWGPEQTFNNGAGTTYSNLHYLPDDRGGAGRLYNFTRTANFNPNILVSNDLGATWSTGGRLVTQGSGNQRPYVRYFSDGEKIHFITTEQHPRNFDNSVYHGYVQNGQLFSSTGSLLDSVLFDSSAVAPAALTTVFDTGESFGGETMTHGWTVDVSVDDAGQPLAIFQARVSGSTADHRFFYARFDGLTWNVHQLAKAGGFLYSSEPDYTGLVALDPSDPDRLFISSKIDPRNDAALPHYEIFEGVTADAGASWQWSPITYNSTVDNIRPIVPKWDDDHTALLWMRGKYSTFESYNLDVVGLVDFEPLAVLDAGDLDRDGSVDLNDFQMYIGGLHAGLGGLSFDDAYRQGDLNGDLANSYQDFLLFKAAYDAANGAGSFAAALQVPEPASWAMMSLGGLSTLAIRTGRLSDQSKAASILGAFKAMGRPRLGRYTRVFGDSE
jgi:hypothetical protein